MLNKSMMIVLHHVKYGESSLVVACYTEKFGRLSCIVNGVRSKKTRFSPTLFQPLSIIEADIYYRNNREIQRIKEAAVAYVYQTVTFDPSKNAIALFLAEVLFLSLREEESNPELFSYIYHSLQLLDSVSDTSAYFHPWFMLHLTRYLGIFPEQFTNSKLTPEALLFSNLTSAATTALARIASNSQGPPSLSDIPYSDRNALLESLIKYYTLHVDGFGRLKSWNILREVFR